MTSVLTFVPQKYDRKEIWFFILKVDEMKNSPGFTFQKHEGELMEPVESEKYQYGVGLMIFANPVCRRFGAIKVDETLQHRGANVFLKKGYALTIVDGLYRRFRVQKLADSGEPGSK